MRTDRIAGLYADPGPFASVHIDVSRDQENAQHHVDLQARAASEQLREQGAPEALVEALSARLTENTHTPAPVSRVMVATEAGGVLFDELLHEHTEQPSALWAPLPDVTPWLSVEDGNTPFVLAVVDHEGGDVSTFVSSHPEPSQQASVGESDEFVNKVRGGGWSHLRYQHTSENVWARNAEAVVDQINHHVHRGFRLAIVAGDPQSRSMVHKLLGDTGSVEVLEVEAGGGRSADGGDEALHEAVRARLSEHAVARRLQLAHTLKDRLGRDHAVATGVKDVADALVLGQVDTLLFDPAEAAEKELVPGDHPGLALPSSVDHNPIRADLALVAAAVLTDASVSILPSAALAGTPVAALLRWDQPVDVAG